MKVALVHELLTMKGGAERVLRVLSEMFPDAPIYTLLYDERKLGEWFPKERVRVSKLQNTVEKLSAISFQLSALPFNHHLYLSCFPKAIEAWDFSMYDLVISSSSAFAHGIITNGKPKHISFVNSPARFLWDRTHDVLERASQGVLGPLKRTYLEHVFHKLRVWDSESSARADVILAASKEVQRRIELYWRKPSTVLYPPIDDFWLLPKSARPTDPLAGQESRKLKAESYFLVVSTLVPYKRITLAIEACGNLGIPLKIVGEGPDRSRLERLAQGKDISFLGYRPKEELRGLYGNAIATVIPGDEDFNLVALESMACGTPVIAFARGGPLETVIEGTTGEFFREAAAESLMDAVLRLSKNDQKMYSPDACRARAAEFSRATFEKQIRRHIDECMQQ